MECKHEGRYLTKCPVCDRKIYLHHILEHESQLLSAAAYPVPLTMLHGTKPGRHALTLYLDKDLRVRGTQVSNLVVVNRR